MRCPHNSNPCLCSPGATIADLRDLNFTVKAGAIDDSLVYPPSAKARIDAAKAREKKIADAAPIGAASILALRVAAELADI